MTSTDKNFVRSVINSNPTSVITIGSTGFDATKFPGVTSAALAIAGGADGVAPVRTDYSASWSTFDSVVNSLVIYAADAPYAATGTLAAQIHGDAVAYAAGREDAFVVIDTPSGLSVTAAQQQITSTSAIFAANNTGNIAASYYPWYNIKSFMH